MLEARKSPRRKMVLAVKVSIDKVTHLAHTLDITETGARLGGLRTQLQRGVDLSDREKEAKEDWQAVMTVLGSTSAETEQSETRS
jgi:hypothetical protein